jgi:hypothetical protein
MPVPEPELWRLRISSTSLRLCGPNFDVTFTVQNLTTTDGQVIEDPPCVFFLRKKKQMAKLDGTFRKLLTQLKSIYVKCSLQLMIAPLAS